VGQRIYPTALSLSANGFTSGSAVPEAAADAIVLVGVDVRASPASGGSSEAMYLVRVVAGEDVEQA
jgi:hypothetical protein